MSFAATACVELHLRQTDLSEQFLFWAIKAKHDPLPNEDGTRLKFARSALSTDGVCTDRHWPYQPAAIPVGSFQGGARPTSNATRDAATRRVRGNFSKSGTASMIHRSLASGKPTCIALPVFSSTSPQGGNNWTSPVGQNGGRVLDPPPGSTARPGHAVCVTGFVPDSAEALGGYFVIRNSWGGVRWGRRGTAADPRNPEPGYGSVSATYVDKFALEWLNL